MSKHWSVIILLCGAIVICAFTNQSMWVYLLVILTYLGVLNWGIFDIRQGYFIKTIYKLKNPSEKEVLLSFDDGATELTPLFLDVLKKYNVKALFFCIGKQIEKYPEIVQRIVQEGHWIGNHTYSHTPAVCFASTGRMIREIEQTDTILAQMGIKTEFFRPPYGITNPHIAQAVKKTGKKVVGWNIRSLDTIITDENRLFKRITSRITTGNIILMHDTSYRTLRVLERLLQYLTDKNYKTTTDLTTSL